MKTGQLFRERTKSHIQEIEDEWKALTIDLEKIFGEAPDLQSVLFLIGLQELGKGYGKYSKDQKMEVFHIAICSLLEPYGFYVFMGLDEEGFPHWEKGESLPNLTPGQQTLMLKQLAIDYLKNNRAS